jgi:hypothetical protein
MERDWRSARFNRKPANAREVVDASLEPQPIQIYSRQFRLKLSFGRGEYFTIACANGLRI